jgi:hypothetical protein
VHNGLSTEADGLLTKVQATGDMKWKGYPITEATWEHASAFSTDGDMLKEYQDRHQL